MSEERKLDDVLKQVEELSQQQDIPTGPRKYMPAEKPFIQRILQGNIKDEDIPNSIRENWMRSVFSAAPFAYTADIFDGKAHVTFSEPDIRFRNVYRAATAELPSSMYVTLTSLSILLHLREISGELSMKFEPPEALLKMDMSNSITIGEAINAEYSKLSEKLPSAIMRMLPSLWSVYSFLIGYFTEKGMPTSF